jgi:AcrR family transcriptional regulator
MRYSSNHKAETRQRIIGEAARRFRKDGIDGTGLVPLMKALGLTHGGFYAHFPSKDALVEASLAAATEESLARWQDPLDAAGLSAFLDHYLSEAHRDDPGEGCPLPSLCAELGLRGKPSPITDGFATQMAARLDPCTIAPATGATGIVALATLVGAITLARSVADPDTSKRILDAVRAAVQAQPE